MRLLRAGLSIVITPIQLAVNAPSKAIGWASNTLVSRQMLLSENESLRKQQLLLQAKVQKLLALQQENKQLRALLSSAPKASEHVLAAQLLAVDETPFTQQVMLDRGSNNKVFLGQPVVDAHGVMGQVIAVNPFSSNVMLLTDPRSAIPVQDNRNGLRAIVVGQDEPNSLQLIHVPLTADVKVGDVLVTSGLGQRFPVGYPVGTISNIQRNAGERFANISVKISARINRSRQVLLVWPMTSVVAIKAATPKQRGQ